MRESMRFCQMTHSMKTIEILLNHIGDKNKFKNRDSLFTLVQCFKTIFCYIFIRCFKTIICFIIIWFNVSRLFLSLIHKKLFAFPFTLFTSIALYTHAHNLSYHPISNTLRQKMMSFAFNLPMTPT